MGSKRKIRTTSFFGAKITAIISSSLVLFLLGILVLLTLMANELSTYVKENIGFSVILSDNISDAELSRIQKNISISKYVKSCELITKERALKELTSELGENPQDFLGSVPLLASVEVKLKSQYANNDSISLIEREIRQNPYVQEVLYRKAEIQLINDNIKRIGVVLLSISAILMMISFALLNNTIRLSVYSKRFILHAMKLVGASHSFIRRPFIISSILNGIFASFLAIGMLSGLLYYLATEIDVLVTLIRPDAILIVFGIVLLLGILLSWISSYFSLTRYLRMRSDNLYSI